MKSKKAILRELDEFVLDSSVFDRPSLLEFRALIKDDKYKEAYEFYEHLDTFVRDGVSDDILIFLRAKDTNRKLYKVKFSLVTSKGKTIAKAIGEYHLTEKEKKSPMFASSVYNAAQDWQEKQFKLKIEEIT